MKTETLQWLVNEFRSMTRDLTIYEMREAMNAMRKATEDANAAVEEAQKTIERLIRESNDTKEFARQLNSQADYLGKLEKQLEDTEFKRGITESELNVMTTRYENLKVECDRLRYDALQFHSGNEGDDDNDDNDGDSDNEDSNP